MGLPYGQVDRICKLIPNNPANPTSLGEAIKGDARIRDESDQNPEVEKMLNIGLSLEGLYRNCSTHAAGLVIGDNSLQGFIPLYRDPRSSMPVTQFKMKWAEASGLVKFDFLGLKTLTVLAKAIELMHFLSITDSKKLYLVGDIIDCWRLRKRWYWPQEHNDVMQKIMEKSLNT